MMKTQERWAHNIVKANGLSYTFELLQYYQTPKEHIKWEDRVEKFYALQYALKFAIDRIAIEE